MINQHAEQRDLVKVFNAPDTGALGSASFGSGAAQAKAEGAAEQQEKQKPVEQHDGFVMPALEELMQSSAVAKQLKPAELKQAYEQAALLNISDAPSVMDFGLDIQKRASQVTREFIAEARQVDLQNLTDMANKTNKAMEELGVGDMRPGIFDRAIGFFLPSSKAEQVKTYFAKHRQLSDVINETEQGMTDERLRLLEHHGNMKLKIDENRDVYNELTNKIATAELSYAANLKMTEELKKQYEGQFDGAKAREIQLLDQALARQKRRINTLGASRLETLTALNTMDMQLEGINSQIAMIDDQSSFNRLVWDNSILMVATDKRMQNAVQAVQYNREQIEKMLKERGKNVGQTLSAIIQEQGQGVVNAAVLEYAAAEVARMNRAMITGAKELREKMNDADKVIQRMDSLLKDSAANALAMTDEDVAKLDTILENGGVTGSGSDAGGKGPVVKARK